MIRDRYFPNPTIKLINNHYVNVQIELDLQLVIMVYKLANKLLI